VTGQTARLVLVCADDLPIRSITLGEGEDAVLVELEA